MTDGRGYACGWELSRPTNQLRTIGGVDYSYLTVRDLLARQLAEQAPDTGYV